QKSIKISFEIKFLNISKFELKIVNGTNESVHLLLDTLNLNIVNKNDGDGYGDIESKIFSNVFFYNSKKYNIPVCIRATTGVSDYSIEERLSMHLDDYFKKYTVNIAPNNTKTIIYNLKNMDPDCYDFPMDHKRYRFQLIYPGEEIKKIIDKAVKSTKLNSYIANTYSKLLFINIKSNYSSGYFWVDKNE
ncbi:MAG: hypothetical protein DI598_20540, partial [Pseudopedobacter saltans]